MKACFVSEAIEFQRGQDPKKALDIGIYSIIDKLNFELLGGLWAYWGWGKNGLDAFVDSKDNSISGKNKEKIILFSSVLKTYIKFGKKRYFWDDTDDLVKEVLKNKDKIPYMVDWGDDKSHLIAYSSIPLPAATKIDLEENYEFYGKTIEDLEKAAEENIKAEENFHKEAAIQRKERIKIGKKYYDPKLYISPPKADMSVKDYDHEEKIINGITVTSNNTQGKEIYVLFDSDGYVYLKLEATPENWKIILGAINYFSKNPNDE